MKPWLQYSLIRLGVFALAFIVLMVAEQPWWLAALVAAVLSFAVAYVFFGKLRDRVALDLQARRSSGETDPDADSEDKIF